MNKLIIGLSVGSHACERMFQGWCLILILLILFLGIAALSYLAIQQVSGTAAEWQVRVPPIPTAFTGRDKDVEQVVGFLLQQDVRIVSVTGGPGYGKSSVAIATSHQLIKHGIPVCYLSLSEADSIDIFIMTLAHALTKETKRHPDEIKDWVGMLKEKTVLVLDNVDQLTLKQTELRHDFIKLLKDIVAESIYLHLVVVTRYRFKVASNFEEIHLQPLTSLQTLTLLRHLMHTSRHVSEDQLIEEQLQMIANETGGIPLAIKVVGQLVKSGVLSVAQVAEELSIDPVSTLSEDSFMPDEQLKRCIDLSYKHLSPLGQKCFLYAASFPGSFDRQAKKHIIDNLTDGGHCLNQLVDRSLVEYSAVSMRYSVHTLLSAFARDSIAINVSLENFSILYASHYIVVLSEQMKRAKSSGNISSAYTTLVIDYHNFLQLLHILSSNSMSSVTHMEEIELALETFHIMQSRFPYMALLGWWERLLLDVCKARVTDFKTLSPQFLNLSTKLAQLLAYHEKYWPAKRTLLFAHRCILEDEALASSFQMCEHPQLSSYTTMLQVLAKVCENLGAVDEAHMYNQQIQSCIRRAPDEKAAAAIIPQNFCSDGIDHVRHVYEDSKDFHSALRLFDALVHCRKSEAVLRFKILEDTFELYVAEFPLPYASLSHTMAALRIAKRMHLISNHEEEVKWLLKSVKYVGFKNADLGIIAFKVYFRLTKLYWHVLNDKERAMENGNAAYATAMNLSPSHVHYAAWQASLRLADILNQIDGHHEEAAFYFQEALDHLPFINSDAEILYTTRRIIEMNLASLYFQSRQFSMFLQHSGQWAKLAAESTLGTRNILDLYYSYVQFARSSSLTADDSFNWQLTGLGSVWYFLKACLGQAHDSIMQFMHFMLLSSLEALQDVSCLVRLLNRLFTIATQLIIILPAVIFTSLCVIYFASVLVFSFHYFLYVAVVKHKLWMPKHLLVPTKLLLFIPFNFCIIVVFMLPLIFNVGYFLVFLVMQSPFMTQLYHNVSMRLPDDQMYAII